ncbi:PREDICTED: uncharacterized protein LOC108372002 [Rhagoletis zephyria]|uniref:uncharacterized protein LOC108372002 n=1 Tax=Rhagoletis zephyria TaxID=28612 RepID=UPI000811853F|nr:PREDICTED: uncharacterized protein LOC108372002 [Rhagoletis zephyria]
MVVTQTASSVNTAGRTVNGKNSAARPSNGTRQQAKSPVPAAGGGASGGKGKSTKLTSRCILRTVTAFLASSKRNSSNAQQRAKQTNKRRRQRKMDELSGKLNPKLLENLRKKTKFSKDEIDALCRIYRKLISNSQYAAKTLATGSSSAAIVKPHATVEVRFVCLRI